MGNINSRITVQSKMSQPRHKCKTLFERIMKTKEAGGMAQEVESLPNKYEALSSNPSTTKKKKGSNCFQAVSMNPRKIPKVVKGIQKNFRTQQHKIHSI
jgi:hypothetical protein